MSGTAHSDDDRALGTDSAQPSRVGWGFIALYALSYTGGSLLFLAPLLVSLALKVRDLVGADAAPGNLALVAGTGSLLSIIANPVFGRLSDRTTSRWGMRRPWMVTGVAVGALGTMVVATAQNVGTVLVGWCLCQIFFNATLAAQTAILADQVPTGQRGVVSGVLGLAVPAASVTGTYLVQLLDHSTLLMFAVPCAVGGAAVLLFVWRLPDRRLDETDKPPWSLRELAATFYVSPRSNPDFAWAFLSRFLLVTAYAFLVTFQTFFLLEQVGSTEDEVPRQVYLGTVAQSVALVTIAPIAGRISDRVGRRKVFVIAAAVIYACALFVIAGSTSVDGYLVGMAIGGVGFGIYIAIDLALVVDVLTDPHTAAKDLGVLNIAGALPFALAPAVAPGLLALGDGSYAVLYAVAGACALGGALAVAPIKNVR
ncbi:MFS transporter [Nocardioides eburneiflavus]|uniref:MFS transporter n=1 Tax=Nocardioides eburneiflavus TaxID=2518372 RepID=A0A4Z1CKJ9_9ACTN|nr:MFS transporter [Nocardioides eburneiflavus]